MCRAQAPQLLGNLRRVDALLAVVDGFSAAADPDGDLERLELELLVADRDHVERRLERVSKQAKSGDPKLRDEAAALERLLAHVDAGQSVREWEEPLPPELAPLTTKPVVAVVNGPAGIDLKLEAELSELPEEEAAAYRDGESALDEIVRRLFEVLGLVTFFTAGDKEARGWTLRRGQTALEAAGTIHSDIARGFIRCEVVRWERSRRLGELRRGGSPGPAAARGEDLRGPGRRRADRAVQCLGDEQPASQSVLHLRWQRSAARDEIERRVGALGS